MEPIPSKSSPVLIERSLGKYDNNLNRKQMFWSICTCLNNKKILRITSKRKIIVWKINIE